MARMESSALASSAVGVCKVARRCVGCRAAGAAVCVSHDHNRHRAMPRVTKIRAVHVCVCCSQQGRAASHVFFWLPLATRAAPYPTLSHLILRDDTPSLHLFQH